MRRSKSEIYLHIVWSTRNREPLINSEIERIVHRCIEDQSRTLGCEVIALNGMPDHVHLLAKLPASLSASQLVKQVKGVSSHLVNEEFRQFVHFAWQEGFAVYSISRNQLAMIVEYIKRQKERHSCGKTWDSLEESDG